MKYLRIALCGWAFTVSLAPAFAEELTLIDVPGSSQPPGTQANGINPRGDIVGVYTTNGFNSHGFLLRNGTFTTIDVPGAVFPEPPTSGGTVATAINPQGDIVGYYNDSTGTFRGFLLSGGTFTTINVPGSALTVLLGINARGDIVGQYVDSSNPNEGVAFLLSNGSVSTITVPGAAATVPLGINSRGDIVGSYYEAGFAVSHGFVLSNEGTLTSIDVPGAVPGTTQAFAINSRGDIVGTYFSSSGFLLPFLRSGSTFTAPITEAMNTETCECQGIPMGINSRGDIVGLYYDAVAIQGFLLSK
jgi:uncharacterized membrane protein